MGLFSRKPKAQTITTTLNGNTAKGRQEILNDLLQNHNDLIAWLDIKNSAISLSVGTAKNKCAGTVDSKITRGLVDKYEKKNGLACDITIGPNYEIKKTNDGILSCTVTMTIIPE